METGIQNYVPGFKATDSQWILFHKKLDAIFSRKEANIYWIKAWGNRGGDSNAAANTATLRDYIKKKGIDIAAPNVWQEMSDQSMDFMGGLKTFLLVTVIVISILIAFKVYLAVKKVNNGNA